MRIVMCANHPDLQAVEVVGETRYCAPCHEEWRYTRAALEDIVSVTLESITIDAESFYVTPEDVELMVKRVEGFVAARIAAVSQERDWLKSMVDDCYLELGIDPNNVPVHTSLQVEVVRLQHDDKRVQGLLKVAEGLREKGDAISKVVSREAPAGCLAALCELHEALAAFEAWDKRTDETSSPG